MSGIIDEDGLDADRRTATTTDLDGWWATVRAFNDVDFPDIPDEAVERPDPTIDFDRPA